jgi:hypothetical protein
VVAGFSEAGCCGANARAPGPYRRAYGGLQNFRVSRLLVGRDTAAPAFTRLLKLAGTLRVPVEYERRPQTFIWDGVQVDILWPENSPEEIAPLAKNNDSLVIRLKLRDRMILLPGDAEKEVEYQMLEENDPSFLHSDVLKVGHHGSKNSTMPEFLARWLRKFLLFLRVKKIPTGILPQNYGSGCKTAGQGSSGPIRMGRCRC